MSLALPGGAGAVRLVVNERVLQLLLAQRRCPQRQGAETEGTAGARIGCAARRADMQKRARGRDAGVLGMAAQRTSLLCRQEVQEAPSSATTHVYAKWVPSLEPQLHRLHGASSEA